MPEINGATYSALGTKECYCEKNMVTIDKGDKKWKTCFFKTISKFLSLLSLKKHSSIMLNNGHLPQPRDLSTTATSEARRVKEPVTVTVSLLKIILLKITLFYMKIDRFDYKKFF